MAYALGGTGELLERNSEGLSMPWPGLADILAGLPGALLRGPTPECRPLADLADPKPGPWNAFERGRGFR